MTVPIDIEDLVQWAMSQTGYLPWRGVSDRELAFDHGYTVIPKGCGLDYRGGQALLRRAASADATAVIEAIKTLDGEVAAMVIACGRQRIRPNWLDGVEPRLVARTMYGRRRKKRRGRPVAISVWVPCEPGVIRAARAAYSQWHGGLVRLAAMLAGALSEFTINGLGAPAQPWEESLKKTA